MKPNVYGNPLSRRWAAACLAACAILACPVLSEAACTDVGYECKLTNNTATSVSSWRVVISGACAITRNMGSLGAGQVATFTQNADTAASFQFYVTQGGTEYSSCSFGGFTGGNTWAKHCNWTGGVSYTNCTVTLSLTNTSNLDAFWFVSRDASLTANSDGYSLSMPAKGTYYKQFSQGSDTRPWYVYGPGGPDMGMELKGVFYPDCVNQSNPPNPQDPSGGTTTDPVPDPNMAGVTNNADAAVLKAIQEIGGQLQALNQKVSTHPKQDQQSALLDQGVGELGAIRQTLQGMSNQPGGGETGIVAAIERLMSTNKAGFDAITNRQHGLTNMLGATNGYEGFSTNSARDFAAAHSTGASNSIKGLVPSIPAWVPANHQFDSSWVVSADMGGHTWSIDLNPMHHSLVGPVLAWIREILTWVSFCILAWACYVAFDNKHESVMLLPMGRMGVAGTIIRLMNLPITMGLAAAAFGALAAFPALLVALYQDTGILNSVVSYWPSGSTIPGVKQAFQLINAVFPIEVFVAHLLIYLGFRVLISAAFLAIGFFLRALFA